MVPEGNKKNSNLHTIRSHEFVLTSAVCHHKAKALYNVYLLIHGT